MCPLRSTDAPQPHGGFVWQDQREGWKSNGSVFLGSALNSNFYRKEKMNLKPLSRSLSVCLSLSLPALLHPSVFIVTSSADTAKLEDCSCVFTKASPPPSLPRPQPDLGLFHQHCLPLKTTFSWKRRRRGGKKYLWAVKLPRHTKRHHYWDKSPHSIP